MNTKHSNSYVATPLTLKEAVLEAVNELKVTNDSFTAHDVTAAVRTSVNAGDVALPGLEAQPNTQGIKYWVKHESVKDIVTMLANDGTLSNLGMVGTSNNGTEMVYNFTETVVDSPNTDAEVTDITISPVAKRVATYLSNVGTATVKQIQSALKINGVTCKDLVEMLDEWGYSVSEGTPNCFSTYTVVV